MRPAAAKDAAILARWSGRCPRCDKPIERGSYITRIAGNVWAHSDCKSLGQSLHAPLRDHERTSRRRDVSTPRLPEGGERP